MKKSERVGGDAGMGVPTVGVGRFLRTLGRWAVMLAPLLFMAYYFALRAYSAFETQGNFGLMYRVIVEAILLSIGVAAVVWLERKWSELPWYLAFVVSFSVAYAIGVLSIMLGV